MSKRLYVLGGPMHQIAREFRTRGYHSQAVGVTYLAGIDVTDVSKYETGEDIKWVAYGEISVEMLDRMEEHFGDRMSDIVAAMVWKGDRL